MRRLARLYATAASLFLGAALTAALFAAVAARLAPEWLEEAGGSLSRGIARFTGAPVPGAGAPPPPPAQPRRVEAPVTASPRAPAAPGERGAEGITLAAERAVRVRREAEAWRAVRSPLERLLEALGDGEAGGLDAGDAPRIAERIDRAVEERLERRKTLAQGLEPRVLARVLVEDGSIPDARAMEMLDSLEPAARAEVIDRLSRLAPRRAARLLDRGHGTCAGGAARGPAGGVNRRG